MVKRGFSIFSKLSPVSEANHPECDHAGHSLEHCSDLPPCLLPPLSFTTEHDLSVISAPCKKKKKCQSHYTRDPIKLPASILFRHRAKVVAIDCMIIFDGSRVCTVHTHILQKKGGGRSNPSRSIGFRNKNGNSSCPVLKSGKLLDYHPLRCHPSVTSCFKKG